MISKYFALLIVDSQGDDKTASSDSTQLVQTNYKNSHTNINKRYKASTYKLSSNNNYRSFYLHLSTSATPQTNIRSSYAIGHYNFKDVQVASNEVVAAYRGKATSNVYQCV